MSPAKQPGEPTAEDKRAARIAAGPQQGGSFHVEWAESAFMPGRRFQYVVIDADLTPWDEHDNVTPAVRVVRGFANEEPYAF